MVLHNPNNWHWVNKDVSEWARDYLERSLTVISVEEGDVSAKITQVETMTGDVDVSQRKGKVITLFDVELKLAWEGITNVILFMSVSSFSEGKIRNGETVSGSISVPEVAHDTEEDEYVVCSLYSSFWNPLVLLELTYSYS